MKKYQIGIIGCGEFTPVLLEFLAPYAEIIVSSRANPVGEAGFGAQFGSLEAALSRPIIIPSIPSQFFREFFTKNKKLINPKALVIDVCSVKVKPLQVLTEVLPETCQIIGTHPLFGPSSIAKNGGREGFRCAVCPVRVTDVAFQELVSFLDDDLKLTVLEKTPEQHDREMAYVQGLSHYIGRVMECMDIPESDLSTLAYDDLMDMKNIQGKDSWELFRSIMEENVFADEINQEFKKACLGLDEKLRTKKTG